MDCRTAMRRDYRQRRVAEKRTLFELYYCYGNYHLNFEQYIIPFIMSHFPFLSCPFSKRCGSLVSRAREILYNKDCCSLRAAWVFARRRRMDRAWFFRPLSESAIFSVSYGNTCIVAVDKLGPRAAFVSLP